MNMKKSLFSAAVAALGLCGLAAPTYRAQFSVQGYAGSEPLANFPVSVRISESAIAGFHYADCAADGADIAFEDSNGNPLDREIDVWDPYGESLVWVRLPLLVNGTAFAMTYSDAAVTAQPHCQTNGAVWRPAGYVGVWHMNSTSPADASCSGNDGTGAGSVALATGVVGSGLSYPNTSSYVSCGSSQAESALTANGYTIEGWVNLANTSGNKALFGKSGFISYRLEGSSVKITTPGVADYSNISGFINAANEWHQFTLSFIPNTTGGAKHYLDGVLKAAQDTGAINNTTGSIEMWLGRNQWGGGQSFVGLLDEYRLSATIRSADWIAASYATASSPSFLDYGEATLNSQAPFVKNPALSSSSETTATFTLEVRNIGVAANEAAIHALVSGNGDPATETAALATVTANGVTTIQVPGLSPATPYTVQFLARSVIEGEPQASAPTPAISFSTPAVNYDPTVALEASTIYAAAADMTVTAPRFGYSATAIDTLTILYGTASNALSQSAAVAPPTIEGGTAQCRIIRLAPGTTYYAKAVATNDLATPGTAESPVISFTTKTLVEANWRTIATTGDGVSSEFLNDNSTIVKFLANGSFSIPENYRARLLLVGGGGAGGNTMGGGGGAGGVVEVTNATLAAGTYTVTVGAGGTPGTGQGRGGNGGNTSISLGGLTLHEALGGGGGGGWVATAGSDGGSGGGGCNRGLGGNGTTGQGLAGANGGGDSASGGGGGACHAGYAAANSRGGNGGEGAQSDITGTTVIYGGGGGGGGSSSSYGLYDGGFGGSGGGGDGGKATGGANGADGLGGGGGGGGWANVNQFGGSGGSGVLVVRIWPNGLDPSIPALSVQSVAPGAEFAVVTASLAGFGFGAANATVSYKIAASAAALDAAQAVTVGTYTSTGDCSFVIGGLADAGTRHIKVFAVNDIGVANETQMFTVVPYGGSFDPVVTDGAASTKNDLGDVIYTFTSNATFTIDKPYPVRYLAVAGGGGGGRSNQAGGGGGAGGMLEGEGLLLEPGDYVVTVGEGGAASTANDARGGNGGDTWLGKVEGDKTNVVFKAIGGGGGGSYNTTEGLPGGSGGGAGLQNGSYNKIGGAGTSGQGNAGGNTSPDTLAMAGGGGGAGATGATGTATASGDGGAGKASDITGETVYYAGGGGGGGRNENVPSVRMGGAGGLGGGGHGRRAYSAYGDENGVDGFGGGGGGSCGANVGGRGGSGVLILRGPRTSADAPEAAILSLEPTRDGATVTARLEYTGVADKADLTLAYTLRGGGVTNAIATTASAAAGDTISCTIPGLTFGATYDFIATASNAGGETAATASVTVPAETMSVTATTGAIEKRVGNDLVAIYTNPAVSGTFVVANAGFAEVLLVGGGGGGGRQFGGGGGAGGFVHLDNVYFAPGTYSIEVGAGGAGAVHANSDTVYAGDGGDSILRLAASGEALYTAFGGGGGASSGYRTGRNGGSGGGSIQDSTSNWNIGGHGVPGQGHDGSAGGVYITRNGYSSYEMPGGGGGAGEPGHDFDQNAFVSGAGGDGLPCSITGEEVWYAGGGGGGAQYVRVFDTPNGEAFQVPGGDGGRGGGGRGHRANNTWYGDEAGVDGLGGGGGGGARDQGNNATCTRNGSRGGNGTVIIRWKATPAASDAATIDSVEGAPLGAIVKGRIDAVASALDGATLEIATAVSGGPLGAYTLLGAALSKDSTFTLALSGLAAETAYDYAIRVVGGDISGACTGSFTTLAAAAETTISVAANEADATAVDVTITLASAGALSVAYGLAPDSLTLSQEVASPAAAGTYTTTISGLGAGKTWYFAPVVGTTKGEAVAFALPPVSAVPAGDGYGLWQTTLVPYNTAALRAVLADASLWETVTMSNAVSGVLAANCPVENWRFQDPVTKQWFIWNSPKASLRLYAYRGYMYMEGGKTYIFGSRFAQFLRLVVDGTEIINFSGSMTDARGTFTPSATGWYAIDARVGRNSDTFGVDGDGVNSWTSFGLAFNTIGAEASTPESNWTPLMDDGNGSLLRPFKPACRTVSLVSSAVDNGSLALTASVGAGESAASAYVVYGVKDAVNNGPEGPEGPESLESLEGLESRGLRVVSLGTIPASAEATTVSASVPDWGVLQTVARIALVTDGVLAFTEPVAYAATVLPNLESAFADAARGDTLVVSARASGGTAPYTARLFVGDAADSLEAVKSSRVNNAGAFTVSAEDLVPGRTVYWQLVLTDASGAKVASDVLSIALPGASRLYQQSIDGGSYAAANVVVASQRTLQLGGTLSVLGAGDTWVGLLYGKWFPSETEVPAYQAPFHEGDLFPVASAGAFSITKTFDWDETIRYNWMVTNSNGIASWSTWRPANESRTIVIADAQTYTWKGGARGDWADANSWQNEGIWADNAGFPRRGSRAFFEAGTTAIVEVGDLADNHGSDTRFSQLVLGEGADVTFTAKAGSAKRLVLSGEGNAIPSRPYTFDPGRNSTLTLSGARFYFGDGYPQFRTRGTSNEYGLQNTGTTLRIVNGSTVTLGSSAGSESWRTEDKADTTLFLQDSTVTMNGTAKVGGARSIWIIDNARVTQSYANDANDNSAINLRASSKNGEATLILKGAQPVLKVGKRLYSDGGDANQYIDFVVPEAGWREAPLQTHQENATRAFGCNMSGSRRIVIRIPTNSPAVIASATLDVPLVNWPAGIDPTYVTLSADNLPHPATDSFYTTTEAGTGNTILWARLVGQTESADLQISDFRQTAATANGSTITFMAIPGSEASGATVSATVLDASGENAVAGASVMLDVSSVSAPGVVTATVGGLEAGAQYTLSVTLTDTGDDSNAATATFQFWTVGDYGAGFSSDATTTATDGPFTVWTFNDTATGGQTFNVTKPGYAEVLIVGGGGSGGGGAWGNYGGGGGGGGQVRSETVLLLPGAYPVRVGAGGARITNTDSQNGKAGSLSFFDDYAAVGGGYGAYNAVGGSGASGGGGSNNKAGGAATAGFAGGFGFSDGGGAGGGGAGGAGSDSAKDVGGNGGAGVTRFITGQPAIYGAGGGGGGTREKSVAGAAGASTAGAGAVNLSSWVSSPLLDTVNATDGFGGGGGGGCGSWDSTIRSLGAMKGGKGGDGTVIVRMRTATALVPEPQFELRSVAPRMDGADLEIDLFSLGTGGDAADILLAWDETASYDSAAGFTSTNNYATWNAAQRTVVPAIWFKPSTAYTAKVVVTNGTAFAESAVFTFTTLDEEFGNPTQVGGGSWSYESGMPDNLKVDTTREVNYGVTAVLSNGTWTYSSGPEKLSDGYLTSGAGDCGPGAGRTLTWTFASAKSIHSIIFSTTFGGAYAAIGVSSIDVCEDGVWRTLPDTNYGGLNTGDARQCYTYAAKSGEVLTAHATAVRVNLKNNVTGNYTILREVAMMGGEGFAIARPVTVASTALTEDALYATLSIDAGAEAAAITAFWGDTYQGTNARAWAGSLALGSVPGNETAFIGAVPAASVADKRYLRFRAVTASGGEYWTQVVYPLEMEEVNEIAPQVAFVEATDVTGESVKITGSLLHAGSAAVGGRADVSIEFSADAEVFSGSSTITNTQMLAASATAGTLPPVAVTGLRADRIYTARLKAANAGGQVAYSEPFTFATASSAGAGSPGALSSSGLWQQIVDFDASPTADSMAAVEFDPSQAEVVEGAIMGYNQGIYVPNVTSALSGNTYMWADRRMFIYSGYINLEANTTYWVRSYIDDNCLVTIDGQRVRTQLNNSNPAASSFTPSRGGWLPIDIRISNGTGGYGANLAYMGLGFNTTGPDSLVLTAGTADLTAPTGNYARFIDPGDGSLLRTNPRRNVSVRKYAPTVSGCDFTIDYGSYLQAGALIAAYGATDGGTNRNDWANTATVGTAAAVGGTALWSWTGDASATRFFRFFTDDGETLGDSGTVFVDAVNPYVAAGEFAEDGDRITVHGTVVAEGASAATVAVEWCDGEAFDASAAQSQTITGWTPGVAFSEVIAATPFTNVWVRLVATNAAGGYDATAPVCIATRGAAQFGPAVTPTVNHRTVTYSGTITRLGAGSTEVVLYTGPSADALSPVATNAVTAAGAVFSFAKTYPGLPQTIYYAFRAHSETQGGSVFDSWTATNSVATRDDVIYTWKADVYEGDWNDPANWTPSAHASDSTGYPNHSSSTASFANCTAEHPVTVHVNGNYAAGTLKAYGTGASSVTLAGDGPAASGLTAGITYGAAQIKSDSFIEFRDLTLTGIGNWDFQRNQPTMSNIVVRFSNVVSTGIGEFGLSVPNARWEFLNGSSFTIRSRFNFGGTNSVLVVDNSQITTPSDFHFNADSDKPGPMTFIVRGENPRIKCGNFYIYTHANGFGTTIVFDLPVGGYADPPIQPAQFASGGSAGSKFDFAVDPLSPALCLSRERLRNMVMVQATTGIYKEKIVEGIGTVPSYHGAPVGAFRYDDASSPKKILLSVKGWGPPPTFLIMR